MDNKEKGDAYEYFIKNFLLLTYVKVYLWKEIPLDILIECGLYKNYADKRKFRVNNKNDDYDNKSTDENCIIDTGCDILYHNGEERIIVQCKDHESSIGIGKLAGFFYMLLVSGLKGELYYTSKITKNLKAYETDKFKCIKKTYEETKEEVKTEKLKPRNYQLEAYECIKNIFRGILWMCLALGKTLVSILWAKQSTLS